MMEGAGSDKSIITLKSGTTVTLSLSYAELAEKIDEGYSPLDLKAYCETPVPPSAPEVGDRMPDGTIFAGISPDTNQPMYAAPADASLSLAFNAAVEYAAKLEVGGKKGFRLPTEKELGVLYKNKDKGALAGSFNAGSGMSHFYWSSTHLAAMASGVA